MKTFPKILMLAAAFVLAFLVSCDVLTQDEQPASGTGKVKILITDAPFPADMVDEVQVTIDRVELRMVGATSTDTTGGTSTDTTGGTSTDTTGGTSTGTTDDDDDDDDDEKEWIVVSEDVTTIDLLKLQNGITEILAASDIPVGKYDMIRLHVVEAFIKIEGNSSFPLKIPSGTTSGLKIKLDTPITVTEEGVSEILVDFDLSRSFIVKGNPKNKKGITGFMFKPVIRAVNYNQAGGIYGKISEGEGTAVSNAMISVKQGETTVATALSDSKGNYHLMGLTPGTYTLEVEKEGYALYQGR